MKTVQLRYARIAGLALLLICLSAGLSNDLIVAGDAAATAHNILAHERQFRVGVAGELFMLNCDVLLAVAFYVFLKPVNAQLALLGTFWRFANALVQGVGVVVTLVALGYLHDAHYLTSFSPDQMQAMARQLLEVHDTAMEVGLVFFGLGAATHAYLLWVSRYIPRALSGPYIAVTVVISASCSAVIVFPTLDGIIYPWLIAPDFFVELSVGLWLLLKGASDPNGRPAAILEGNYTGAPGNNGLPSALAMLIDGPR